jgi:hypothetical protein
MTSEADEFGIMHPRAIALDQPIAAEASNSHGGELIFF